MMKWLLFIVLALFCFAPIIAAQADCPSVVAAALQTASEACAGLERNQACYGNINLQATGRVGATDFAFEQAGDIVDIADIDTLRLSSMSLDDESWGVALMKVQANIPDSSPENVLLVLFGNTEVVNQVTPVVELPMMATSNVNVRLRPYIDTNNVIASLTRGEEVVAIGRLADNSWILIEVDEDARGAGWVSAEFLTGNGDINTLAVIEPSIGQYAPMQAFRLATGGQDAPCADVANSGMLIQTPSGVGEINLLINEVDIRLGSTIYVQANAGIMTVSVLEGFVSVMAEGTIQRVPAGAFSTVPLDAQGIANGEPAVAQPYVLANFEALPLILLSEQIVAATPVTPAQLAAILNPPDNTISVGSAPVTVGGSGTAAVALILTNACPDYTGVQPRWDYYSNMTFSADGSQMSYGDWAFNRVSDGVYFREEIYSSSPDNYTVWQYNFTFPTPTTVAGQVTGDWVYSDCTVVYSVSGTYTP